ncbi:MAG: lysostaphin resistance A-like protein [Actinomycetota bacterium]
MKQVVLDATSTISLMLGALGFFVVHVIVWTGLVLIAPGGDRVDYDLLGDASTPWVRQFVLPLTAVLILQSVYISRMGMWSEILRDRVRSQRKWLLLPPVLLLAAGIGVFANDGLGDASTNYWIGMTLTMLLVGVTEEITFRGIIVAGARRTWNKDGFALIASSVLFGLFHLPNWLLGQSLSMTIRQVVVTALLGMVFFALRRASGTLVTCIVLHAVYDWMIVQGVLV